jgi:hypothetical protein
MLTGCCPHYPPAHHHFAWREASDRIPHHVSPTHPAPFLTLISTSLTGDPGLTLNGGRAASERSPNLLAF